MKLDILKHRGFGYKSQLNLVYSNTRTPFNPVLRTGYEDYLRRLTRRYNLWVSGKSDDDRLKDLEDASELMREHYPGNYRLIQKQDPTQSVFCELVVEFDNPKEELIWKMKWT